tara:strand:- start:470 stop:2086 length:1617 start_codon:yes stop_codon:yes gene_type:complete
MEGGKIIMADQDLELLLLIQEQQKAQAAQNAPLRLGGFRENLIGSGAIDTPGEYLGDAIRSAFSGGARGIRGLLGLPETVFGLSKQLGQKVTGKEVTPLGETYLGGGFDKALGAITSLGGEGGENEIDYRSPTKLGKYAGTVGEFVAPGGIITKLNKPIAATMGISGIGSEAAGQAAEGKKLAGIDLEGPARIGGALLSPWTSAKAFNTALKPYDAYIKPGMLAKRINTSSPIVNQTLAKAMTDPTRENLRVAKNAAYHAADDSGVVFNSDELMGLAENSRQKLFDGATGTIFNPKFDTHIKEALARIDDVQPKGLNLIGLDKLKQEIYQIYKKGRGEKGNKFDPRIKTILDDIEDLINKKTQGNEYTEPLLNAARLAAKRYKKHEILETKMEMAMLETSATGSGGNILNKYKQAINKILRNKKDSSYFDKGELDAMKAIVMGDVPSDILRNVGKLSPNGNGLMLHIGAAAAFVDPSYLAISAAGLLSKATSDRLIKRQIIDLEKFLVTGQKPTKLPLQFSNPAVAGGITASQQEEPY